MRCEWCWNTATLRQAVSTSSVAIVDMYYTVMAEQQRLGKDANCPLVRVKE